MKLVVDTNVLFSFFRDNPARFIIMNSEFLGLQLFTPEYAFAELSNNKSKLVKFSKATSKEVEFIISALRYFVEVVPKRDFKEFESKAKQLIHDKDVPIFALALKLNCAIWSMELGFKRQSSIEIFNTEDLRKLF